MRSFKVYLEDSLYTDFYKAFPDHGHRTAVLRKCVRRIVNHSLKEGGILDKDLDKIASNISKEMEDFEPCF